MREVTLRVEDLDSFSEGALAMGRRLDEGANKVGVAKLAFESMAGLLKLLTANRWTLMATMRKLGPVSIRALAKALARISQQTKCIGAANQRKILLRQSLTRTAGIPRCRQSVARRCLNLQPSRPGKWWRVSMEER